MTTLQRFILVLATGTALFGLGLMAYGLTLRYVDPGPGPAYPNTQHISPTPYPTRR